MDNNKWSLPGLSPNPGRQKSAPDRPFKAETRVRIPLGVLRTTEGTPHASIDEIGVSAGVVAAFA